MAEATPFAAQDLKDVRVSLDAIGVSAEKVSKTLTGAFAGAIVSGKSFDQTLQSVILSLSKVALKSGLEPLQQGFTALLQSGFAAIFGAFGGGGRAITPFADGGIVSRPTLFGAAGGTGLMGERGAEAILPLARGPDGKLGVASNNAAARPTQVTINITTPDAESFRRSQVQISGALARAVAHGQRGL